MVDRFKALDLFKYVAETQSFTKAAEIKQLPRSTVSSVIKQLEKNLGTKLFYRTTRQVHLTQNGALLLEKSRHLMYEFDEIENLFRDDRNQLKGNLKIDVPSRIAAKVIAPALPDFFNKYPDIKVEMGATDRTVDLIGQGIDCAIRVGQLSSSNLIAKPLGHFEIIICASPDYIDKFGTPSSYKQLKDHFAVDYLSPTSKRVSDWTFIANRRSIAIEMKSKITVNHAESYIECALAGLGLIKIPGYDVQEYLQQNQLVQVLGKYKLEPLPVFALYPHREYVPTAVRVFIEWIEAVMNKSLSKL